MILHRLYNVLYGTVSSGNLRRQRQYRLLGEGFGLRDAAGRHPAGQERQQILPEGWLHHRAGARHHAAHDAET